MRAFMTENTVPLHGVQACVFDAYGTLFDFAAAARKSRDVLGDDIDRLTALWRDKQLQYTWLRAAQERHMAGHWRCARVCAGNNGPRKTWPSCPADVALSYA